MSLLAYELISSSVGQLLAVAGDDGLQQLHMQSGPRAAAIDQSWRRDSGRFCDLRRQLVEYFAGERAGFDLELAPKGSEWQRRVWRALLEIPHGSTASYSELAARLGRPRSARAVGHVNAANPISIVVPCHRLIGVDGSLTGYAGGIERKQALLELERQADPRPQRLYRLLGADGKTYESARKATLGGHRDNKIYGRLDCAGAASWIARGHYVKQRVFFSDEAMAIAAGFRPCGGCMRERYRQWKGGEFP